MSKRHDPRPLRVRLTAWVDGDQEARDRTLYIMEQRRPPRYVPPTEEEHEAREQQRLHHFFNWYPLAAVVLCALLTGLLLAAVLGMPVPGVVEPGETLAAGSWELELLGESCLLFLAISAVRVLLRGRTEDQHILKTWPEVDRHTLFAGALAGAALLIILVTILGGIAGGAAVGAALAIPPLVKHGRLIRCRGYAQACSLLLCVVMGGLSIYTGTHGLRQVEVLAAELLELSAGLSSACAIYSLCSLAAEHQAYQRSNEGGTHGGTV